MLEGFNKLNVKIKLATELFQARINSAPVVQLSETHKFSEAEAYAIQEQGITLREEAGEKVIGRRFY